MPEAAVQDADETVAEGSQGCMMGVADSSVLVVERRAPGEAVSAAKAHK